MEISELVSEWLRYSKNDLDVAIQLFNNMHPRPLEIICYHAQQSAEKALKSFLIQNDILPPKIHDLNRLCEMCSEIDNSFDNIAKSCGSLNKYSVLPRYPFEILILENDAESAIQKTTEIHEWVKIIILPEIQPQNNSEIIAEPLMDIKKDKLL